MTKILVIDDEAVLREEIVELLMLEGYEVRGAADGRSGIDTVVQYQPNIILCDVTMPGMNGYDVLAELRQTEATRHISFIFMTAHAFRDDVLRGIDLGADSYLIKPFYHKDLMDAIENCLDKK